MSEWKFTRGQIREAMLRNRRDAIASLREGRLEAYRQFRHWHSKYAVMLGGRKPAPHWEAYS